MKTALKYLIFAIFLLLSKFSAAQVGNCDSLQVLDFQLNPFNTEELVLRSAYSDFDNFINYPGFSLVDENQYILAQEEVNFFGMSTEQVHTLEIVDLQIEENIPVEGTLQLWSFFFENLECEFPGPFLLRPEMECTPLRLTTNLFPGDSASGQLIWSVEDNGGNWMAGDTLNLDTLPEVNAWDICIPAGCEYVLQVSISELSGPGFSYTFHYNNFLATGATGSFNADGVDIAYFDLYSCLSTTLAPVENLEWQIFPNPAKDHILFNTKEIHSSHSIKVSDLSGREVAAISTNQSSQRIIDCSDWAPGVYYVHLVTSDGYRSNRKLVIAR